MITISFVITINITFGHSVTILLANFFIRTMNEESEPAERREGERQLEELK